MHREPLVMIPGTLCDERIFAHQAKYLRKKFDVILVNYKELRSIQDWPTKLLDQLPSKFSLAGFSLGGIWALELLRLAPKRVNRLVLIASNAEAANKLIKKRSGEFWRSWKTDGPRAVLRIAAKKYFHYKYKLIKNSPLLADMALKTKRISAKKNFEWAATRTSSDAVIASFDKPILLISGSHDRLCPSKLQENIIQIKPSAEWIEFQRCGHFIPLEKPKQLSHSLNQWMSMPTSIVEK